ncbi:hypothetical protein JTB14_017400 [Gonioctena quinquepunctata]|nr:hypothetical protein JTB14_017400 [Gonioctena quinquepunctata]
MTQEEIVSDVKTVAQGLEALRSEYAGILHGLHEAPDPIVTEQAGFVQQSADMIELGLCEAQVSFVSLFSYPFAVSQNKTVFKDIFVKVTIIHNN